MIATRKFEFAVERYACLDADGRALGPLPAFAEDRTEVTALYRAMCLTRTFDAKAVALQRTGRLGTFASSLGQEAVAVGVGAALAENDVLLPSFREQGAMLARGVSATELLLYWGGDERGSDFAGPRQDFPVCIPVASHVPHAVGVALAFTLRGEPRAALCVCGDGATSKGDFSEALNIAGVWSLPAVFVVNNNQWAISVPRAAQSAAETLAQKAIAAGVKGEQVDGNDVIAVRHACEQALTQARAGGGPRLIEALSYRLSDHTTADDAGRYRDDAAVSERWREEPIVRLRRFLSERFGWNKDDEEALLADCNRSVEASAEAYLRTPPQPLAAMFETLYAELPGALRAQAEALGDGNAAGEDDA